MIQAFDPRCVVDAISRVVGGPAALHEPRFVGREWDYVKECIDTGWISTAGKFVERFEDMLVEQTGVGHAIAVVNGTAALHSCLMLVGVGQDDEVVIPALTFAATAAAVAYCGAIPHFADSCPNTLGLDPAKLDAWLSDVGRRQDGKLVNRLTERRIAAVVCMHTYGHPVDLDALVEVCNRHGLPLVEDAAESLGTTYKGRHTGNYGVVSAVSFNGNKIVTTGGGGDPHQRPRFGAASQTFDNYGQAAASMGIQPRHGRLQLSYAEHQRGPGLRAIRTFARDRRG